MALNIETTANANDTGFNSVITTGGLTTVVANCLLLARVTITAGGGTTIVTDSGSHTWTKVISATIQSRPVEIWVALSALALVSVTVTSTGQNGGQNIGIAVDVISGVDTGSGNGTSAIGATVSANGASGSPTVNLITTRNNSWVFAMNGQHEPTTASAGSNQTIEYQLPDSRGFASGDAIKQNSTTSTSGTTVTSNLTGLNSDWNIAAVEVLPPAAVGTRRQQHLQLLGIG